MMNGGKFNGSKILNNKTIDKMLSPKIKDNNSQGLCWHTFEFESLWGHISLWRQTGGDPGIETYMFFNPTNKIGMITFQNNSTVRTFEIIKNNILQLKINNDVIKLDGVNPGGWLYHHKKFRAIFNLRIKP